MALNTVGTSGLSASTLNQIIAQTMAVQRRPLDLMQTEQDQLSVQRTIYSDLQSILTNLNTQAQSFLSSSSSSIMGQKAITSSDSATVSATASTSASAGVYTISDIVLAKAHSVRSGSFTYADQALGLTAGTFVIGGVATRNAALTTKEGAPLSAVTAGADTDPASGQTELGTDSYYVEFQQQDSAWKFRLVNSQGQAMSIADGSDTDSYTSGWQDFADVKNTTYDTGRGLKLTFGDSDPTQTFMGTAAPTIAYHAEGASISVTSSDTLEDIADKVNDASYASGNTVQATIVNKQLVFLAEKAGYTIEGSGSPLGAGQLGMTGNDDGDGDGWNATLTASTAASFKVNNLSVTRYSNTGLTDVINGVTLDLLKATSGESIKLTVKDDNTAITDQLDAFAARFNALTKYLDAKTAVTLNSDGKTYTRGALAGDSIFTSLRLSLMTDLNKSVSGLSADAPTSLREIGISFDDSLQLTISDSSALSAALSNNRSGVAELFDKVFSESEGLLRRVNQFTGSTGIMSRALTRMDSESKDLTSRMKDLTSRLTDQEAMLTSRYSKMLQQLALMQAEATSISSLWS